MESHNDRFPNGFLFEFSTKGKSKIRGRERIQTTPQNTYKYMGIVHFPHRQDRTYSDGLDSQNISFTKTL